jgi:histidyl-tRNA synthetase
VKSPKLVLNSLGSVEDKNNLSGHLREKLGGKIKELCEDCQNRFERNVFRILDCKNASCRKVVDELGLDDAYLSKESRGHYRTVKEALSDLGIRFEENFKLVRGLDYYTHTVFEITSSRLGSQDALCAGGRYDHLVVQLGGSDVPAVGFALGIERVILALEDPEEVAASRLEAFIVAMDDGSLKEGFRLLKDLRGNGISADMSFRSGSMKSLMREAAASGARSALIIGENEMKKKAVTCKDMQSGEQREVAFTDIVRILKD